MVSRRDFCKTMGALGLAAATSDMLLANPEPRKKPVAKENDMIWAYLIHLGFNLWTDYQYEGYEMDTYDPSWSIHEVNNWAQMYRPDLTCESDVWDKIIDHLADTGANMALIDLADGVEYESHPEISVKGAWSANHLRRILKKMREKGIEPIPKLNFSACHKAWMGDYQYRVSSKAYYGVCRDLIEEVADMFDNPRFFHLGMDEETWYFQTDHRYCVVRNGDLWWHDLYYLQNVVERLNIRPWIWSDYVWDNTEIFYKKMPKSILQSNWNYEDTAPIVGPDGKPGDIRSQTYIDLEAHGYDQIPTGTTWRSGGYWGNYQNIDNVTGNAKNKISPQHLKGIMQTTWLGTLAPCLDEHIKAIDALAAARKKYFKY